MLGGATVSTGIVEVRAACRGSDWARKKSRVKDKRKLQLRLRHCLIDGGRSSGFLL